MSRRFANQFRRFKPSMQARIDYSHPAAQGLIMACPFNELAGPVRNLCTYQQADTLSGTAPVWTGSHLDFGGAGYASFGDVPWFDGLSAFTIAALVKADNVGNVGAFLNKRSASSIGSMALSLACTTKLQCMAGGAAAVCTYDFTIPGGLSVLHWLFCVYDAAAGANLRWKVYADAGGAISPGSVLADNAISLVDNSAPLVFGAINTNSPIYFDGQIHALYAWAGVQPLSVRDALLDDPYCFLDDGPRRVYFVPGESAVIHEATARPLARSTFTARATVVRGAAARFLADSRAAASSTVVRSAQARFVAPSRVVAYAGVVRGASVRVAGVATVSARLAAIRLMSARVNGRSAMLVGEARKAGLKLTIGDVVKVRLVIGDELAEG